MAHSVPSSGTTGPEPRRLPAGQSAAGPPGRRRIGTAAWMVPLLLGIVYGFWAAEVRRSTPTPGPISTGNVVFGVVSGIVVAALAFLLHQLPRRVPMELRALAWGGFAGVAFGYVYSLSDASMFRTVLIALLTAGGITVMTYYRYYTTLTPPDTHRYYALHPRRDHRIPT